MGRCKDFDEETVLQKALECFWQNGYEATSTRDLAQAMGISYGSVYNTFRDKRTLYLAALDLYISRYAQTVVQQLNEATSARAALAELLTQVIDASVTDAAGCFAGNAIAAFAHRDPEVAGKVRAMNRSIERAIQQLLERAQKADGLTLEHDPAMIAYLIINIMSGIRLTARLDKDQKKLHRMTQVVLSLL